MRSMTFGAACGLYWFRQPWQEPGSVGRVETIVPPAPEGRISDFVERYVPAGYTFGENHDNVVDGGEVAVFGEED